MRPFVEEKLRGRQLPLIMAHKGGAAHGRENALETIQKVLTEFKPDIVEIDVRKSRDGILLPPWISALRRNRRSIFRLT